MPVENYCRELLSLTARIDGLDDIEAAPELAAACRRFCAELAIGDCSGAWVARALSQLNDHLAKRIVATTAGEFRLPPVEWCWLLFGSEGRQEQTFVSDQDNGLIFNAADDREAASLRQCFLPFAQAVNERLDRCGFTFCHGGIMAGNERWCLSLDEWRTCFSEWVRYPEPHALMHATIFFDFRPLCGDLSLGQRLRAHQQQVAADAPRFLYLMAENALAAEPPLNFLGEFVLDGDRKVDVKKAGCRLFVDAARIFALASGVADVETVRRLLMAGPSNGLPAPEIGAANEAFSQMLRIRLCRQALTLLAGGQPEHRLAPDELNEIDRAILRDGMRQAKRLQQKLKVNYAL